MLHTFTVPSTKYSNYSFDTPKICRLLGEVTRDIARPVQRDNQNKSTGFISNEMTNVLCVILPAERQ